MYPSKNPFRPFIYALLLAAGLLIGSKLSFNSGINLTSEDGGSGGNKIENIINFIVENYVDDVKKDSIEQMTLSNMLQALDPHSDYIPASDLQAMNEPLEGNFDGIGVEFNILKDTIVVVNPISGGPSEEAGILSGDKIITVDGKNVAGIKITNQQVFKSLRGKKGSKVNIKIKRSGKKGLIDFSITRGEIPIYSIDAHFMLNANTGYIKISRFAATTYKEYLTAFNNLKDRGMKKLIIDLRGNGGGYLNAAVSLADEFLNKGMQIVYTMGKASPKREYRASTKGGFESDPLAILIDEGSASASEILAGAVQDNDRGLIIGRRSFGKGLVQEQMDLPDGSAIRLTTARYYTPSGRCIQKSYKNGLEEYFNEEYQRYQNGELLNPDSIKFADSLKFHTASGKTVYGGGGIMPDIFVAFDTSYRSTFLNKIVFSGLTSDFCLEYVNENREQLKKYENSDLFIDKFSLSQDVFSKFLSYAEKNTIKASSTDLIKSKVYLQNQLKALIGRTLFGNEVYYRVLQSEDKTIQRAISELK